MSGANLSGVVLAFPGGIVMMLGLFLNASTCLTWLSGLSYAPYGLAVGGFLLGVIGGALSVGELWKIGIGQKNFPAEGTSQKH